ALIVGSPIEAVNLILYYPITFCIVQIMHDALPSYVQVPWEG
ncbi:MAG: hypothetical protein EZS28_050917, partial [Streblomastix strix]